MGTRHKTRQIAMQALFALDANPTSSVTVAINAAMGELESVEEIEDQRLLDLVESTWDRRAQIDGLIEKASRNWKLGRMDRVDRSILRLGVYELLSDEKLAAPIVISEALELAKEFSAPEAPAFINGILDRIAKDLNAV